LNTASTDLLLLPEVVRLDAVAFKFAAAVAEARGLKPLIRPLGILATALNFLDAGPSWALLRK
jgi:hypothetical protein